MRIINFLLPLLFLFSLVACQSDSPTTSTTKEPATEKKTAPNFLEILKNSLTFYSSFDTGPSANFAKGDRNMWTANSRKEAIAATGGMTNADHQIGQPGQSGAGHLKFGEKTNKKVIFYKSQGNVPGAENNWTGTISFWLKVDPAKELAPGFTDPIQITDVNYDDASIWVDFTKENPRDFRLGVFGDKAVWVKDTLTIPRDTLMEKRFVRVKDLPFSSEKWTHVLITYQALGTNQSNSSLYLDGEKMGSIEGIADPFTWDVDQSNIYLGLNFIGAMDEFSIYNIAFKEEQVKEFYQLKNGVQSIFAR